MCAEDKDRWDGMFQMERDDADLVSALKERLKKRKEKVKKKEDKKDHMGLKLLFGGESVKSSIAGRRMHWLVLSLPLLMWRWGETA